MSMSRKDFTYIAKAINELRGAPWNFKSEDVDTIAKWLGAVIGGHNSGFIDDRFLKACGVEVKKS